MITTKQIRERFAQQTNAQFRLSFRTRTYRTGQKVVFLTISEATWSDVYPQRLPYTDGADPLPYDVLIRIVHHVIPGAQSTSGGLGGGTFRLPDSVIHIPKSLPRKAPDQMYRKLYRYHIAINRGPNQIITHVDKSKGAQDPTVCLRSAFHSLGQLLQETDWQFSLAIRNRGTGQAVISMSNVNIKPKSTP